MRVRYARPTNLPPRVSTLMRSPWLRYSGTWTTAPVSMVAGLVPPWTVSHLKPGSVYTISDSMNMGGWTPRSSASA